MPAQLFTNYDTSKIFIGNNRYITASYTNATGAAVTLTAGRLMGRVLADNKVLGHVSSATDGSQQPLGVLADTYVVANGATASLAICIGGDIAQEKVILGGADTLATAVSTLGTVGDLIRRNSHINLVAGTEMTGYDNA